MHHRAVHDRDTDRTAVEALFRQHAFRGLDKPLRSDRIRVLLIVDFDFKHGARGVHAVC
jgi:hypothetical protein